MGKIGRTQTLRSARRAPLDVEIEKSSSLISPVKSRRQSHKASNRRNTETENETGIVDAKLSKKILNIAASQQDVGSEDEDDKRDVLFSQDENSSDDGQGGIVDEDLITDLSKSTPQEPSPQLDLAAVILERLKQAEEKSIANGQKNSKTEAEVRVDLVYKTVAKYLSKYTSGKIPKAFKIIPKLANWEEVLAMTEPLSWTPNAMYEGVRIFISSLKPCQAQRFLCLVLLPAVRENIALHKKLNPHYYKALKKAFFKPSAWFQGILFPTLLNGCTSYEAVIFGSVMSKVSIPPLHTAAAIIRLCSLADINASTWSAATTYCIHVLLNKKAALPKSAVDVVYEYFMKYLETPLSLPVIWHQALLVYVQRYKVELTKEYRQGLLKLIKFQSHSSISQEIRKEIVHASNTAVFMTDD